MVELLTDFPPHVAAYHAEGKVSNDEYKSIVMARVDEVAEKYGKINFLVKLETNVGDYTLMSFLNYLKVSFEHYSKWNRMAIVTDQQWVRAVYDVLGHIVHGEIKVYKLEAYESAKEWVSAPLEADE